jgi:hypothetical protein
MIKRYLEDLSVKMGFGGEITDEVMARAEEEAAAYNDKLKDEHRERVTTKVRPFSKVKKP